MFLIQEQRVRPVYIIALYLFGSALTQNVPEILIEPLQPKGLRVSIPDSPTTNLFVFHGNVNRQIQSDDVGSIFGEVLTPTGGRWAFEDQNVELKTGDVINYYVLIFNKKQAGRLIDNLKYTVGESNNPTIIDDKNSKECTPSVTTIRGHKSKICPGDVIFEDNFTNLNEGVWQIEQKLPFDHPEYPFVSYQRLSDIVKVKDGDLNIRPQLQQKMPGFNNDDIFSGTLDLRDGCSEAVQSCIMTANGANILPPIVSGRISSKSFAFKYGEVQIRAKLPLGDWLYPEILLEPFMHKYGISNFASGVIKIAVARGNKQPFKDADRYDNEILHGGPIMDFKCHDVFSKINNLPALENWGENYHTYTLRWEPEKLIFLVDGSEWARVEPGPVGLHDSISRSHCPDAPHTQWSTGDKMAPFDDYFYITLGVAAGGVLEFPDNMTGSQGHPKPWKNMSSKSKLHFWLDLDNWSRTWNQNSALLVDWIKVNAL